VCHERAERYDLAVAEYEGVLVRYTTARGIAAVRARKQHAVQRGAELAAQQALAHEAELTALPAEPATLAVLPVALSGDTTYQPLSRGLAELITTDLAVIRSLRLLERLHIGALLDELELGAGGHAAPETAARVGHLLRAERMVQGVAHIPSQHETIRLQASIVAGDGTVRPGDAVSGRFRDLLDLEKQLVFGLAEQLGIQLSAAERVRILGQGPRNLAAFLAYSAGLEALDRREYGAAARHFGEAVRSDPSFEAAETSRQAAEAAPVVEQAGTGGGIVTVAAALEPAAPVAEPAAARAARDAAVDLTPTLTDALRQQTSTGSDATDREPALETRGLTNLQGTSSIIRIIFRRPP
jgi:TolB-like protein